MNTLLLDTTAWDLTSDLDGNIAMATNPYAIAQDVASALRLFKGECFFDTTRGVPYFNQILGRAPPLAFLKAKFVTAAMTVPEVVNAIAFVASIIGRKVTGQVQVTTSAGVTFPVGF